jgi:hypothetical protein
MGFCNSNWGVSRLVLLQLVGTGRLQTVHDVPGLFAHAEIPHTATQAKPQVSASPAYRDTNGGNHKVIG